MVVFLRFFALSCALALNGGAMAQFSDGLPPRGRAGAAPPAAESGPQPKATREKATQEKANNDKAADSKAGDAKAREPVSRESVLDDLYGRLAKAQDAEEATGIATAIERVKLRSGSDTADLLMSRATAAAQRNNAELAEDLLDRILLLEPDWAEAWQRRATLRAARDDVSGALEDLAQALQRDPRHLGALAGLGFTMLKQDNKAQGLRVLRRLLDLHPQFEPAKKAVERLGLDVDGRAL